MFLNIKSINVIYSNLCSIYPHCGILTMRVYGNMPQRIIYSQICYNTPMFYIAAILVKYCRAIGSWLS